ncbi:MAG: hypothetical protein J4F40_09585 [Alphaproteobacteria bacterium]|nr:hypothetical protein [Alphaproteobacteria bacterium]
MAQYAVLAALAVIEMALIVRTRAGTEDPIRAGPAYLGGILRREPADCRPEITLPPPAAAARHHAATPALFSASEKAERRFWEFFTARIRNPNTRLLGSGAR